ncbi:MAG: GNAT family N-acetyltransferase [Sumerlaeia bacterium]
MTAVALRLLENLDPQVLLKREDLTFPPVSKLWYADKPKGPLFGVAAGDGQAPVGAIVAELHPEQPVAQVITWRVLPAHRKQGIGFQLMSGLLMKLKEKGLRGVTLQYRTDWPNREAIERILSKTGFAQPETLHIQARGEPANLPWLEEVSLPEGFEAFPWGRLTLEERRRIQAGRGAEDGHPAALDPFAFDDRFVPELSFGLRKGGDVVGWTIAFQTAEDTVEHCCLHVDKRYQGTGLGLQLVCVALKKQAGGEPAHLKKTIFRVMANNQPMLQLARKRFVPFAEVATETMIARKFLNR